MVPKTTLTLILGPNLEKKYLQQFAQNWVFPKIGIPQNGWFVMENPIKMDDLGGTPIFGNTQLSQLDVFFVRGG